MYSLKTYKLDRLNLELNNALYQASIASSVSLLLYSLLTSRYHKVRNQTSTI